MLDISAYPICANRLKFQRANLNETGMNAYWAAACVATEISDKALTKAGGFNFEDRSEANGYKLLARLEAFIAGRLKKASGANSDAFEGKNRPAIINKLVSQIGPYGVKAGAIKTDADFWSVAMTLWPDHIAKPQAPRLYDLSKQIEAIGKKGRRVARENLHALPVKFGGTAA